MDVNNMLAGLDRLFSENRISEVGTYLENAFAQAAAEQDISACLTILNEQIGFFRSTCEYDKSIDYSNQAVFLLDRIGMQGTIPYATTLLNVANAYRAAGRLDEALEYFKQVETIYDEKLQTDDFNIASYNNNVALLYQEMGDYNNAVLCLEKALQVALKYEDAASEVATTYTNLGASLLKLGRTEEAKEKLHAAINQYNKIGETGYHYSAALSAMGELCYTEADYENALKYYEDAANELESVFGRNDNYMLMQENIARVKEKLATT